MSQINQTLEILQMRITKKRLKAWGNWSRQMIVMGLGYSHQSIISRLQENKGVLIPSTQKMLFPENKEAQAMDHLIMELSRHHLKQAQILVTHYMNEDSDRIKIKKMDCSRKHYYQLLSKAEVWINQKLL